MFGGNSMYILVSLLLIALGVVIIINTKKISRKSILGIILNALGIALIYCVYTGKVGLPLIR